MQESTCQTDTRLLVLLNRSVYWTSPTKQSPLHYAKFMELNVFAQIFGIRWIKRSVALYCYKHSALHELLPSYLHISTVTDMRQDGEGFWCPMH
ncbi:hypothetical protein MRB53_041165 [Persea americana]|nr:hypothetical protein MRB53_041165 [Persea americana]